MSDCGWIIEQAQRVALSGVMKHSSGPGMVFGAGFQVGVA
ncbi:hypothetical protein COSO111634_28710 [Corallococcus soli]